MCDDIFGDDFDGIDEEDWAILGPMSEELEEERRRLKQLEDDLDQDDLE